MTVIAAARSPEGFAIAADGLQIINSAPRSLEHAQKIFATPFANLTGFAFAWAGATSFGFESGKHADFRKITEGVMEEVLEDAFEDEPEAYFNMVARRIFCELPADVRLSRQPEADVLFAGFLTGRPLWAEINFPHDETNFLPPSLTKLQCSPRQFNVFVGSDIVAAQMHVSSLQPKNLSEAAQMVRRYAQTCVDNNQSISDCKSFGGHVHVATVTLEGFSLGNSAFRDAIGLSCVMNAASQNHLLLFLFSQVISA